MLFACGPLASAAVDDSPSFAYLAAVSKMHQQMWCWFSLASPLKRGGDKSSPSLLYLIRFYYIYHSPPFCLSLLVLSSSKPLSLYWTVTYACNNPGFLSCFFCQRYSKHRLLISTADQLMLQSALNPSTWGRRTLSMGLVCSKSFLDFCCNIHMPHPAANTCFSMFLSWGRQLGPQISRYCPVCHRTDFPSRFLSCRMLSLAPSIGGQHT